MNSSESYHFQVGTLKCIAISDGMETVPAESFIKDMLAEQWSQALLENGYSPTQAVVYFNCLMIQTGQQNILVDAGGGQSTQRRDGALLERLGAESIRPADIDTVIITHGDVDHIGGILDTESQPVFSNASYVLLQEAWEFWSNESLVERWPKPLTFFGRVTLPRIREKVNVVAAGVEFLPGFQLISAPGHRPGHTALEITSNGEGLIHLADTVGHPLLMEHPAWHWYADFRPDQAEKDKSQVLNQAVAQHRLVFGSHLPYPGVGRVTPQGEGWRWQPLAR
jgi:glyoxylase-like metal-dependent hydrolase (beta-lactamase superfamily II)